MTSEVFEPFPKMARLSRPVIITEKLDGANAQIKISEDLSSVLAGSRNRWITPDADNFGFATWVERNRDELLQLGPGRHFGEWWGSGIQRGYGLPKGEKRFSLFNTVRWARHGEQNVLPACCGLVPVLFEGSLPPATLGEWIEDVMFALAKNGSVAAPGFMDPEGIVIFHTAANFAFKKTIKDDEAPKSFAKA